MSIKHIAIQNDGYVHCRSGFYTAHDGLSREVSYSFSTGVTTLTGDIDSGVWAVGYLLSMYHHRPQDFVLFDSPNVVVDGREMTLDELSAFTCYMDTSYPLFSGDQSVRALVEQGIQENGLLCSAKDIKALFCLDDQRFERPLASVGNDIFRAMAAIGYSHKKQVFCFPWLSKKRFEYYGENMTWLIKKLEELSVIAVVPVGK